MHIPVDPTHTHPEEDPLAPLNFDDLLDIAREFEFTRTITHIWPSEEEPSTCHEPTGLEDVLASIIPTPNTKESLPLSMTFDPIHVQEIDLHRSASMCPTSDANSAISRHPVARSKDDNQVRANAEPPITSILRGWSPPNGSQFLDLDDSLMLPQSPRDIWIPPWLATFLAPPCTQPANSTRQSPAMVPAMGDIQPQRAVTEPKTPPSNTTDQTVDDSRKENVPFVPLSVQFSTHVIHEPVRPRSALQTNALQTSSNVSSQTTIIPRTKTPKSRPRFPSALATGGASSVTYAKAPRGGIPPHIARTVTKANILLVEKEREVIRDTFSGTTMGGGRKPSVLRRAAKVEKQTNKVVVGGGSGKKLFACGENDKKEGRATKRARV